MKILFHLITNLLSNDISFRLGSTASDGLEIKDHPFFQGIDWNFVESASYTPPLIPVIGDNDEEGFPSLGNFPDPSGIIGDDYPTTDPIPQEKFEGF